MIIKGDRRGGAKQLADHLLRRDTNEDVRIREIADYPLKQYGEQQLRHVLRLIEVQAKAQGKHRTLYHAIIAPQQGEKLDTKQLKIAVDTLAKNLGMAGHQRIVVEHKKAGRQHFHVVFNIINPVTGNLARLQWTRKIQWNTARQLEKKFGLKPVNAKGRAARQWEHQRGKRSGIDPLKMRKEITAIYRASKTGKEFLANLEKAGYVLTKGKNGSYVLVDKAGDIHGLMRRIEGVKLKDLRQKFPDLKTIQLPVLESVIRERKPKLASKKIRRSKGNATLATNKIPRRQAMTSRTYSRTNNPSIAPALMRPVRPRATINRRLAALMARYGVRPAYGQKRNDHDTPFPLRRRKKRKRDQNTPDSEKMPFRRPEWDTAELLAWAWETRNISVLAQFGIHLSPETYEP